MEEKQPGWAGEARSAGAVEHPQGSGPSAVVPPPPFRPLPPFRTPFMPAQPHFAGQRLPYMGPPGGMAYHPGPHQPHLPHPGMRPTYRPPYPPPPPMAPPQTADELRRSSTAWACYRDAAGNVYYHNAITGATTWQRPPFMLSGAAQQATAPTKPLSSERVAGTDWLEVTTDDGKTFWHNNATGKGTWQVPAEVAAAQRAPPRLDPQKAAMLERVRASGAQVAPGYLVPAAAVVGKQALEEDEDEDVTFTEEDTESMAVVAPRPPLPPLQTAPPPPAEPHPDDVDAAFKALLGETGVHGFSRWERELPKLQTDPRFRALPPGRRRQAFEEYCSAAGQAKKAAAKGPPATQLAASGANITKAKGEAFKALLRERGIRADASWPETLAQLGSEPRGVALPAAQAKVLFREYVAVLQRAEQGRAAAERRTEAECRAGKERQQQAAQAAALANYQTLLTEAVRGPVGAASWSEYLPVLERDPQGRAVHPLLSPAAAEAAFCAHAAALEDAAISLFTRLLEEELLPLVPTPEEEAALEGLPLVLTTWSEAEAALCKDARFERAPATRREAVWRQFVADAMWNRDHPADRKRLRSS